MGGERYATAFMISYSTLTNDLRRWTSKYLKELMSFGNQSINQSTSQPASHLAQ